MKFSVSKEEMLEKLSNIQNIVEKKNTMPILSHFLLSVSQKHSEKDEEGTYIIATDLETAIKEPLEITIEEEGKICVPARKLFEIVREIEGDLIFEAIDEQWLRVRAGTSDFRLACLPSSEFPAWPELSQSVLGGEKEEVPTNFGIEPSLLLEMIEKTIYSAGESDTRYTFNGLLFHMQKQKKSLTVVGTDGHRLALLTKPLSKISPESLPDEIGDKKMIVPRKAVSELRRFLSKTEYFSGSPQPEVRISIGRNHILFSFSGLKFLTRLIEGTYPNYEQVIPQSNEKKISLNRDAFIKALRRVSVMSRERANAVRIDFGEDVLTISSSNPDIGEAKEEVPARYSGERLTIGFNARYLIDSLSAIDSDNVMFEIQDPLSPALLIEEGEGDYKCVIMPMRI